VKDVPEVFLVIGEDHEVIHVADVRGDAELFKEPVIDAVEIDISAELTGEVADGQSTGTFQRCEQVIESLWNEPPRTTRLTCLSRWVACDNSGKQGKCRDAGGSIV
jgi:hypothetical protein